MRFIQRIGLQNYRINRNLLVVLLFIPLLFIDNRSSHDWGDDFAQYIHQAANLVKGIPQSDTGFIYSEENYIGPRAYPPGFPMLLAPVYALAGNNMIFFTSYISLFYLALAFLVLIFYRKHFSATAALVLSFILVYNPQLLVFKQEVMSDIPFTVFLIGAFILYPKLKPGNYRQLLLFSLLLTFILLIRSVGFVLLLALFTDQFLQFLRDRKQSRLMEGKHIPVFPRLLPALIMLLTPLILYFAVNTLLFRIPSGGSLRDYLAFYYSGNFLATIPPNLEQYVEVFRYSYIPAIGDFRFVALICGSVFQAMALIGFVRKMMNRIEAIDLFFILYMLILLVFPNNYSAYRLLIPVGFILLYYAALGFKAIRLPANISSKQKLYWMGGVFLLLFAPGLYHVAMSRTTMLDGPQQKQARQAFTQISRNLPDSARIVFFKPRALALYTGKQGIADPFAQDPNSIHLQLMDLGAQYILIHKDLTSESMKRYVRVMKSRATEIWKNKDYRLLKINPPKPEEQY